MNFKKFLSIALLLLVALTVAACKTTKPAEAKSYTYRTFATGKPTTLNHLNYKDSVESDLLVNLLGSLYSFEYNADKTGYSLEPSMAVGNPTVVKADGKDEWTWTITIRDDLKWANGEKMDADDFIYTYRMALDPKLKFGRGNVFYGGSFPILNGEGYYKQGSYKSCTGAPEDADTKTADKCTAAGGTVVNWPAITWDQVGVKKISDTKFSFTVTKEMTLWDAKYQLSSFIFSPVYEPLFEAGMNADRTQTTYGTAVDKFMSSGPYTLKYWEDGKVVRSDKNKNYFDKDKYFYTGLQTTIVKDADAALLLFQNGELDVVTLPAAKYDQFKNTPGIKFVPGATVFRLNINTMSAAELEEMVGEGGWEHKPILQELEFRQALYFAIDRESVAKNVMKTATPAQVYFSEAYSYNPEAGLIYRDSQIGKDVIKDLSPETSGYVREQALELYEKALDNLAEDGNLPAGKISIEYATFDGATHEAVAAWLKNHLETLFNSSTKYPNKFELVAKHYPSLDVYYKAQMPGKFDIALGGISGTTLAPLEYLDVFCSDNRSGLFLNWGFDTDVKEIEYDGKTWSYDELIDASIEGEYSTSSFDKKLELIALLESYLISKQVSIPMFSNSGAVIYSSRIELPTGKFVPVMGYAAIYGTMTEEDKK